MWEAIALQTSTGIAQRRKLLSQLMVTSAGHPRMKISSSWGAAIVGRAKANPAKAPLATFAHYLLLTEKLGIDTELVNRYGDQSVSHRA